MQPCRLISAVSICLAAAACSNSADKTQGEASGSMTSVPGVMNVVAKGLTFKAPATIPSGWTTIRFSNESQMTHFAIVERLPEGQSAATQQAEVAPVFQAGLELLATGDVDSALKRFGDLPAWYGEVVFMGGPGLTAPGTVSEATMNLKPGTYILECYVKTGGVFHSFNPDSTISGMVREFTVTDEASKAGEPVATVHLTVSSTAGIQIEGSPVAGTQAIAVHFDDQTVHENFVGHDVHVVRIDDDLDLGALGDWMDWRAPTGLVTPAPAKFIGGLNEMPAGSTGYFTVTLEPGRYAFVSEVPNPAQAGLLKEFTVE